MNIYSVLEECWVQIFVETISEIDGTWVEGDLIGEFNFGARFERLTILRRKFHIHDAISIVTNFELFMRENVVPFILATFANSTCFVIS